MTTTNTNSLNYIPTQHAVIVGGASSAITSLGLGTSGQVLVSNGSSSDPSFQTLLAQVTTPGAYPYTTLATDLVILVDTSSARTITPLSSPTTGQHYYIKDNVGSAASNNITVTPSGKNIDGAASFVMNVNYGCLEIVYNGTEWSVI